VPEVFGGLLKRAGVVEQAALAGVGDRQLGGVDVVDDQLGLAPERADEVGGQRGP